MSNAKKQAIKKLFSAIGELYYIDQYLYQLQNKRHLSDMAKALKVAK